VCCCVRFAEASKELHPDCFTFSWAPILPELLGHAHDTNNGQKGDTSPQEFEIVGTTD
jgi:hypothetical protein